MDAKEFLYAVKKLCKSLGPECDGCPFSYKDDDYPHYLNCRFTTYMPEGWDVEKIIKIYNNEQKSHDLNLRSREVVKIKVLPGGRMPEKKTKGAAAYDCYARVCDGMQDEWVFFDEGKNTYYLCTVNGRTGKYPLGFALEMPPGVHAFVMARSSMGLKTQLICPIGVGLIDSDYRGEVAMLYEGYDPDKDKGSAMNEVNRIYDGDRIAQLLFNVPVELVQVDELTPTERGNGGFGSTGKR